MEKIRVYCKGYEFYIDHPEEPLPDCGYYINEIFSAVKDILCAIMLREGIKDGFTITIEKGGGEK